jgi:flagellar biosynthesis GTPase FlhF
MTESSHTLENPKKLRCNDLINIMKEQTKNKISVEKGYIQFKFKNEEQYLEQLTRMSLLIRANDEALKSKKDHFDTMKRSLAKQVESLIKDLETKEKAMKEMVEKEKSLQNEIKELKISQKTQSEQAKKEKKAHEEENSKHRILMTQYETKIKKQEEKNDQMFSKLFDMEMNLKEIEKKKEEQRQENSCCICLIEPKTHACVPCGHKKYCEKCIGCIKVCSICKAEVKKKIKIYE